MEKGGFQLSEKIKEGARNPHDFLLQAFELWCNQQHWIMAQVATTNSMQSISRIDRLHSFAEGWELKTLTGFLIFFHQRIFFKLWLPHSLNMAWQYWLMSETTCWKVAAWYLCHLSLGPMTINVVDLAPPTQAFGLQGTHHNLVQIVIFLIPIFQCDLTWWVTIYSWADLTDWYFHLTEKIEVGYYRFYPMLDSKTLWHFQI